MITRTTRAHEKVYTKGACMYTRNAYVIGMSHGGLVNVLQCVFLKLTALIAAFATLKQPRFFIDESRVRSVANIEIAC